MSNHNYHRCRGSVMVEMAGAVVLLVLLVFGITELGRALYQLNMINKAVSSGARYIARVPGIVASPQSDPACGVQGEWALAVERAQNMVIYGEEVGGVPLLPDMAVQVAEPMVKNYVTEGGNSHSDCIITVTASAKFRSIFANDTYPPLLGGGGSSSALQLTATAEERYLRLYYAPATP